MRGENGLELLQRSSYALRDSEDEKKENWGDIGETRSGHNQFFPIMMPVERS